MLPFKTNNDKNIKLSLTYKIKKPSRNHKTDFMKKIFYVLMPLFLLAAGRATAQEDQTEATNFDDESGYISYEDRSPFRLLDSVQPRLGVFLATTPFFTQQSFGAGLDLSIRYTNNLSVGFSFAATGRNVKPDFGYNIGESKLMFYDISLFNELEVYKQRRLEVALRLYTGLSVFHLADNSIKERYWWYDDYGNQFEGERALPIANNYFFRVEPALVLRYRLSYNILIEGNAGYNFFAGKAKFGQRNNFDNYLIQLGIKADL